MASLSAVCSSGASTRRGRGGEPNYVPLQQLLLSLGTRHDRTPHSTLYPGLLHSASGGPAINWLDLDLGQPRCVDPERAALDSPPDPAGKRLPTVKKAQFQRQRLLRISSCSALPRSRLPNAIGAPWPINSRLLITDAMAAGRAPRRGQKIGARTSCKAHCEG